MINNKRYYISLIYRILIVLIGTVGIIISAIPTDNSMDMMGESTFCYYTIQTNILVTVFFMFMAIYQIVQHAKKQPSDNYSGTLILIKGGVMQAISITGIIFWALLFPALIQSGHTDYLMSPRNFIVHLIIPVMAVMDWILFDTKGKIKKLHPLLWLSIPLAYYIFVLIASSQGMVFADGARYPYFFIDPDVMGVWGVVGAVVGILIFFTALGYLFYYLDNKGERKAIGKQSDSTN